METDSKLFLVTEYVNGGEVFGIFLKKSRGLAISRSIFEHFSEYLQKHNRMSEREARHVFRQIVAAVGYCHASGVVHRDLKVK